MKTKPMQELDPLDLAICARQPQLTEREREALAEALATSSLVRTGHELSADFEHLSRVRPGDEALVNRALERALAPSSGSARRRVGRSAVWLAATLALGSVAAAATGVLTGQLHGDATKARGSDGSANTPASSKPRPARRGANAGDDTRSREPRRAPDEPASATPGATLPASPTPSGPNPARTHERARSPGVAETQAASPTAASLFAEASAARRAGALENARALYLELQARFPSSSEASVSRVSLGKLLASEGRAREAEAAFGAYLRSGAGDLREEALVGRADALRALGRSAEERNAREELVHRYPASVHALRARERIAEIDEANSAHER